MQTVSGSLMTRIAIAEWTKIRQLAQDESMSYFIQHKIKPPIGKKWTESLFQKIKKGQRVTPTKKEVVDAWRNYLVQVEKFDPEEVSGDYCFACGMQAKTERCHIVARTILPCDSPYNIHLLCRKCHFESEHLDVLEKYFEWFEEMNLVARLCGGLPTFSVLADAAQKEFEQKRKDKDEN